MTEKQINDIKGRRVGNRIYSGDVIYYADELAKSGVVANTWPNGHVYYEFDGSLGDDERSAFIQACQAWTVNTPIRCIQRNGEANFIRVASHDGEQCLGANVSCSALGMKEPRQDDLGQDLGQDLFIYSRHWSNQSVIRHEIGHALGLIHEHQRPDRDSYVFILWSNVRPGAGSQFQRAEVATATEYDFNSIMHYNNCAFSVSASCNMSSPVESSSTILPKDCNRDMVGGTVITALDYDGVRAAYAPSLHALFKKKRSAECGLHDLSPKQVEVMCGASGCAEASAVTYKKIEEFHQEDCGAFVTGPPSPMTCRAGKVFLGSRYNSTQFDCGFGNLDTNHEWWWKCGCEKQVLPALCAAYTDEVEPQKLAEFRVSRDEKEQATGRYVEQVRAWAKLGLVDHAVAHAIGRTLIGSYLDTDFRDRLFDLLCNMRIMVEIRYFQDSKFRLGYETFEKLASASGLRIVKPVQPETRH